MTKREIFGLLVFGHFIALAAFDFWAAYYRFNQHDDSCIAFAALGGFIVGFWFRIFSEPSNKCESPKQN